MHFIVYAPWGYRTRDARAAGETLRAVLKRDLMVLAGLPNKRAISSKLISS